MTSIAAARHQWDEGKRRLADEGEDTARSRHLGVLIDAVMDELQRRVGQTFTLRDLAETYGSAEDWVREVILSSAPPRARAGIRDTALVQDAAFAHYAQGARDYSP
jgi:hypothetical protein